MRRALLLLLAACSTGTPAGPDPTAPAASEPAVPAERREPPQAACPPASAAPHPGDLVARAAAERRAGRAAEALACAEQALELDARSLPALRERAWCLAELQRPGDARAALTRALAASPDDLSTLEAAAEILVTRLAERDDLEAGRDHALRGADRALRGRRPDLARAGRLHLLAGMAENDLGRARDALAHLDRALQERPGDVDALYERGVALYELCRFGAARRAFEAVLRRNPDDAWAIHHLGLLAERSGDEGRASRLLSRAARLAPRDLRVPLDVERTAFEAEVRRAVSELPGEERRALGTVPVEVEEIPRLADLTAVDPPLSPSILGLFRGPPLGERCLPSDGAPCRSIVLYRRNLVRFARDRAELAEEVRVTLRHEIGHLVGQSDERLRARGLD